MSETTRRAAQIAAEAFERPTNVAHFWTKRARMTAPCAPK